MNTTVVHKQFRVDDFSRGSSNNTELIYIGPRYKQSDKKDKHTNEMKLPHIQFKMVLTADQRPITKSLFY